MIARAVCTTGKSEMLPIAQAARALGTSETSLRRWIKAGAPVARRGRRGRGHVTLIDVAAVEAWRAGGDDAALRDLAARLPELLGDAMVEAHRLAPDKRGAAWMACASWQLALYAINDHLAERLGELPPPQVPESIERLRKIIEI